MESWPPGGLDTELSVLQDTYLPRIEDYDISGLLQDPRIGQPAIVSSFGTESVVLLHYVSRLRPDVAVLFIDTGKHFPETLAYRDEVVAALDLELRILKPDAKSLKDEDPYGRLFAVNPNTCCNLRKVFPLQDALEDYGCWISGQKRFQSASRATVPVLTRDGARLKISPLALWTKAELEAYRDRHDLPRHPLEAQNYLSIGCAPCTRPVKPGEDPRAGRWAESPDKVECGIHLGPDGKFRRNSMPPE